MIFRTQPVITGGTAVTLALALLAAIVALVLFAGCARHQDVTSSLQSQLAPFTQTRDQAVAMVKAAKATFDPQSQNELMVTYTDLQVKANDYAGFLVESADVGSLDGSKNTQYAAQLEKSIAAFDDSFNKLKKGVILPPRVASTPSNAWVPGFASSVQSSWDRYHQTIAQASPQTKATLEQALKRGTVYPNFENIATEPINPQPPPGRATTAQNSH